MFLYPFNYQILLFSYQFLIFVCYMLVHVIVKNHEMQLLLVWFYQIYHVIDKLIDFVVLLGTMLWRYSWMACHLMYWCECECFILWIKLYTRCKCHNLWYCMKSYFITCCWWCTCCFSFFKIYVNVIDFYWCLYSFIIFL